MQSIHHPDPDQSPLLRTESSSSLKDTHLSRRESSASLPNADDVGEEMKSRPSLSKIAKEKILGVLKQTGKVLVGTPAVGAALLVAVPFFLLYAGPAALIGRIHGHKHMRDSGHFEKVEGQQDKFVATWTKEQQGTELGLAIAAIPLQATINLLIWTASLNPKEGLGKDMLSFVRYDKPRDL